MKIPCHLISHEIASGPANMALDQALLDLAAERGDAAYLRTYGWAEPTLSLGYFQSLAEAEAEPRWRSVPLVRRATGGGAIWHHHELTYALIIPSGHPFARPNTALYRAVHGAILAALHAQGVVARRRGEPEPALDGQGLPTRRPFLCFADRDPEDVVAGGSKILGSAQRRRAGSILQHGSLLLRRSETTPDLAGVSDLMAVPSDPIPWSALILETMPPALGLEPVASQAPVEARERAEYLVRTIYAHPDWTRRR